MAQRTRADPGGVAERSGLTVGYLSQVENDKASPSLAVLGQIAAALDVSPAWFLMDDAPPPLVVRADERLVTVRTGSSRARRWAHLQGRLHHRGQRQARRWRGRARASGRRAPHRAARAHAAQPGRRTPSTSAPATTSAGTARSRTTARSWATRTRRCSSSGSTHRPEPARTIDRVTRRAVTYASYLKVPELLALQVERSSDRTARAPSTTSCCSSSSTRSTSCGSSRSARAARRAAGARGW